MAAITTADLVRLAAYCGNEVFDVENGVVQLVLGTNVAYEWNPVEDAAQWDEVVEALAQDGWMTKTGVWPANHPNVNGKRYACELNHDAHWSISTDGDIRGVVRCRAALKAIAKKGSVCNNCIS